MTDSQSGTAVDDSAKYDVAVVYVHGIGAQAAGATLMSWAEPLHRLLQVCGPTRRFQTQILGARDLVGANPEIDLEVKLLDGRTATWLLTEARWADVFRPSSATEVLTWALKFLWRAVRQAFVMLAVVYRFGLKNSQQRLMNSMFPAAENAAQNLAGPNTHRLTPFIGLAIWGTSWLAIGLVLLFAAPTLVALSTLILIGLLVLQRVPGIGRRVSPLVSGLVTSIGDAQVYRDRAIASAAMKQVVVDRISQARHRANAVVVVAHSQGAAIACRTFLESRNWPDVLVTVGAGTNLLNDGGSVGRWKELGGPRWTNVWTLFDPVPAGPLGDQRADVRERLHESVWHHTSNRGFRVTRLGRPGTLSWRPGRKADVWSGNPDLVNLARRSRAVSKSGFLAHAGGVEAYELETGEKDITQPLAPFVAKHLAELLLPLEGDEVLTWETPVADHAFEVSGPEELPVANRWSPLTDHTTYSANLTQVQYSLAHIVMTLAPATATALEELPTRVQNAHVSRVRELAMARIVAFGAAIAGIVKIIDLNLDGPIVGAIIDAAHEWKSDDWLVKLVLPGLGSSTVLVAAAAAIYLVVGGVMGTAWRRWHVAESLRLCGSPEGHIFRLGPSGYVLILTQIASLVLIIWAALPHLSTGPAWAWLVALMGPALLVIWSAVFPFVGLRPERVPARA